METFLQKSRQLLRSHRDLATQALEEAGIPFAQGRSVFPAPCRSSKTALEKFGTKPYYVSSSAGFFLWIDLSKCLDITIVTSQGKWAAEWDLSCRLQQIGVVMSSGYAYHNEVAGWFRVIFSVEVESLKVGLARIIEIYNSSGDTGI